MKGQFDWGKVKFWVDDGYVTFVDRIVVDRVEYEIAWVMNEGGWVAWGGTEVIHETYQNSVPEIDTIYRVRLEASRMIKGAK